MSVIDEEEKKSKFILHVYQTIEENPLWVVDAVAACNAGLIDAHKKLIIAKGELEVALAFSLGVGCKKARQSEYIKDKLNKARPHSLRWDWFFKGGEK